MVEGLGDVEVLVVEDVVVIVALVVVDGLGVVEVLVVVGVVVLEGFVMPS